MLGAIQTVSTKNLITSKERFRMRSDQTQSKFYHEIKQSLIDVGLRTDDLVFVQSSIIPFLVKIDKNNHVNFLEDFYNALTDVIGIEGTICFPAFSYSFFNKTVFDAGIPPKNSMGALSIMLWNKKKCTRTMDPNFSVGVYGKLEKYLTGNIPKTSFGKNSFFDRFYNLNGKLLQIGISVDGSTFVIYFDQKLKSHYRYFKNFTGEIKIDDNIHKETWKTYVRKLDGTVIVDLNNLKERVEQDGYINKATLMDGYIYCIEIKTFFNAVKEYLKKDPLFLLKH